MPDAATEKRVKCSNYLDADMPAWIAQRARSLSTSGNAVVRQAIRAAMEADRQKGEAVS